jgi:hypothetical protein
VGPSVTCWFGGVETGTGNGRIAACKSRRLVDVTVVFKEPISPRYFHHDVPRGNRRSFPRRCFVGTQTFITGGKFLAVGIVRGVQFAGRFLDRLRMFVVNRMTSI